MQLKSPQEFGGVLVDVINVVYVFCSSERVQNTLKTRPASFLAQILSPKLRFTHFPRLYFSIQVRFHSTHAAPSFIYKYTININVNASESQVYHLF